MNAPPRSGVPKPRPSRQVVLVVDDEKLVRWSLREALKGEYQVRTASNAAQAMRKLNNGKRIDALLVDVRLVGMDGLEVARRAKELKPDLKIFVMTGFDRETAPRQAFQVRADGYLPKPFELQMLKDMLASHLSVNGR